MTAYTGQPPARSDAAEMLTPSELKRMIVKLRWIGMEHEAERLGTLLDQAGCVDSVLATPRETD